MTKAITTVLASALLVVGAGCSDSTSQPDSTSQADRWLERGVLTDLPIDLVQALRAERIEAELRVMGLADDLIARPPGGGWESVVGDTDGALAAFQEAVDDDEVVRGIYSDALADSDRLDDVRREVDDAASASGGLNLPGREVTQDYTVMLEALMAASGELAVEVDDPGLAMGVELWVFGFSQHEAAEALFRVHSDVLTGDAGDGGRPDADLPGDLELLLSGPEQVRTLATGSRYQPLAMDLAVAVDLTGVEDLAAAHAGGTPVELLATIEALGDGPGGVAWEWHSFIEAIRLSMNSLA